MLWNYFLRGSFWKQPLVSFILGTCPRSEFGRPKISAMIFSIDFVYPQQHTLQDHVRCGLIRRTHLWMQGLDRDCWRIDSFRGEFHFGQREGPPMELRFTKPRRPRRDSSTKAPGRGQKGLNSA